MQGTLLILSLALLINIAFAADPCGSRGRSCVKNAKCQMGSCVCQAPFSKGDGAFACYKESELVAQVLNDPMLVNFNNESIQFPYPCRYLATHALNDLLDKRGNVIGTCEFMIYSFNGKSRGKFFLHGFDIALNVKYSSGSAVKYSSRHYGVAKYGVYDFKSSTTAGQFYQNGPWGNDNVYYDDSANGIHVDVAISQNTNTLYYTADGCGMRITFVPYDVKDRRAQVEIPGIAIAVDNANNPRWLSSDEVMALAPKKQGGARNADTLIKRLDVEQSIFVRAFKNDYVQNMPMDHKSKCEATHKAIGKCTRRPQIRNAMRHCYWMLRRPRFIYCMDKSHSAKNILRLLATCVKVWCDSTTRCEKATDMITRAGCDAVRDTPELAPFMRGEMCPRNKRGSLASL